jgi:hypothetical protein
MMVFDLVVAKPASVPLLAIKALELDIPLIMRAT